MRSINSSSVLKVIVHICNTSGSIYESFFRILATVALLETSETWIFSSTGQPEVLIFASNLVLESQNGENASLYVHCVLSLH